MLCPAAEFVLAGLIVTRHLGSSANLKIPAENIDAASYEDTVDANGWSRSLRPDGKTEYTKSVGITIPVINTGNTSSTSVGNAPVGVNPASAYSVLFSMVSGTGTSPQALVYRLGMTNSSGGSLAMIFTNPYASSTGGLGVTINMAIVD